MEYIFYLWVSLAFYALPLMITCIMPKFVYAFMLLWILIIDTSFTYCFFNGWSKLELILVFISVKVLIFVGTSVYDRLSLINNLIIIIIKTSKREKGVLCATNWKTCSGFLRGCHLFPAHLCQNFWIQDELRSQGAEKGLKIFSGSHTSHWLGGKENNGRGSKTDEKARWVSQEYFVTICLSQKCFF